MRHACRKAVTALTWPPNVYWLPLLHQAQFSRAFVYALYQTRFKACMNHSSAFAVPDLKVSCIKAALVLSQPLGFCNDRCSDASVMSNQNIIYCTFTTRGRPWLLTSSARHRFTLEPTLWAAC